ncbi:uncharacterized protein [Triticum aestivum]|uniref:uncharacterized protein n=1 Tax=Triticum aestivum TaxID=4565 RepID=UPI00162D265D|nr:uncharacterized protein LOC123099796 [Triticum aestivum]
MGNTGSTSPASLGKSHVPHLEWKIHDFSALLETGATSAKSSHFHYSGYKWFLKVIPMHKKPGAETPYVGLCLKLGSKTLEPCDTVNAVFELSVYNRAKRVYCGRRASHNFDLNNTHSKNECLIPLQELLKSSAFLVDDSCVFGVKILKIKLFSTEKKAAVVPKKVTTVQNLFIQKKGLIKGTYTWTMDNYHELDSKRFVCSPTFEAGGHKWHVGMYPHGRRNITNHVSLFLYLESSDKLCDESGKVVELTLSILDQKNGKHSTITSGLLVFGGESSWGWPKFLTVKKFKNPSRGYVVGSRCVVKTDFTIVGSSNDG